MSKWSISKIGIVVLVKKWFFSMFEMAKMAILTLNNLTVALDLSNINEYIIQDPFICQSGQFQKLV